MVRTGRLLIFAFALMTALLATTATSVALEPPTAAQLKAYAADGTLAERIADAKAIGNDKTDPSLVTMWRAKTLAARGVYSLPAPPSGLRGGLSSTGSQRALAVCIDFADYPATISSATMAARLGKASDPADPYFPYESVCGYYQRSSYGALDLQIDSYGWHRSSVPSTQVVQTAAGREALIAEALQDIDSQSVDLSRYDNNGDGAIDYLLVYWTAPKGQWATFWWACKTSWFATSFTADGVRPGTYAWLWPSAGSQVTGIHETGHALGLPDLYDYDTGTGPRGGTGAFDMMDSSKYDHNAFSKWLLGWSTPSFVTTDDYETELNPAENDGESIVVMPDASASSLFSECFMVEYRRNVGNDSHMFADAGLTIWHLDSRLNDAGTNFAWNNSSTAHKLLTPEESDGLWHIANGNLYYAHDTWTGGKTFTPSGLPSSARYDGTASGVTVTDIEFEYGKAEFDVYIEGRADAMPPVTTSDAVADYETSAAVTLTAADSDSGVARTDWLLDGASGKGVRVETSQSGAHTLSFWSEDLAGNVESQTTVSFVVHDVTAPDTTCDALATYTDVATISVAAADDACGSGIASVSWRIDSETTLSVDATSATVVCSAVGPHSLTYWSTDLEGNDSRPSTAQFHVVGPTHFQLVRVPLPAAVGTTITLAGRIDNEDVACTLIDEPVVLQTQVAGEWKPAVDTIAHADADGEFAFALAPAKSARYRIATGPGGALREAASEPFVLGVKAVVSRPSAPRAPRPNRTFSVAGTVKPVTARKAVVKWYRVVGTAKRFYKSQTVTVSGAGNWSAKRALPKGSWASSVVYTDSLGVTTTSSYRTFRVK
ncbi:MAG: M6 family metalloprotease domain-containing protein [Coriobacteriia bacterium]|nr:M6 family metalloprotease domain-containing protein [Coriobacteriia bacterium]